MKTFGIRLLFWGTIVLITYVEWFFLIHGFMHNGNYA